MRSLKQLDEAWPVFIPQTEAHTLFTLVDRVNVFPDKLAIKFNMPAVLTMVREIGQSGNRELTDTSDSGKAATDQQ